MGPCCRFWGRLSGRATWSTVLGFPEKWMSRFLLQSKNTSVNSGCASIDKGCFQLRIGNVNNFSLIVKISKPQIFMFLGDSIKKNIESWYTFITETDANFWLIHQKSTLKISFNWILKENLKQKKRWAWPHMPLTHLQFPRETSPFWTSLSFSVNTAEWGHCWPFPHREICCVISFHFVTCGTKILLLDKHGLKLAF